MSSVHIMEPSALNIDPKHISELKISIKNKILSKLQLKDPYLRDIYREI